MTDRLRRERELPAGYQFGDARGAPPMLFRADAFEIAMHPLDTMTMRIPDNWRVIEGFAHWNVIEGEHETTHIGFDPASKRAWEP